jgi:hypothetical protein
LQAVDCWNLSQLGWHQIGVKTKSMIPRTGVVVPIPNDDRHHEIDVVANNNNGQASILWLQRYVGN